MPELPEVETVLRSLEPHLIGERFLILESHVGKLRTPLVIDDVDELINSPIQHLYRRAKYIILKLKNNYGLIMHLGMTGSWRLESPTIQRQKHDHVEFSLSSGLVLRYNDPRRFGQIVLFTPEDDIEHHPLLINLAPEPLSDNFDLNWLIAVCQGKKKPIKSLIMDNEKVVGVGNIYASESLFRARISPLTAAGSISKVRLKRLLKAIKDVLREAINAGGTTIKDYAGLNGEEGYFARQLLVYGKHGQKCTICHKGIIKQASQSGRSTYYCPVCQH